MRHLANDLSILYHKYGALSSVFSLFGKKIFLAPRLNFYLKRPFAPIFVSFAEAKEIFSAFFAGFF